jgi:hypothetical protein
LIGFGDVSSSGRGGVSSAGNLLSVGWLRRPGSQVDVYESKEERARSIYKNGSRVKTKGLKRGSERTPFQSRKDQQKVEVGEKELVKKSG